MENSSDPKQLMQLTDFKDCTALEIATEVEHFEIVEYLVQEFGDLMDEIHLHECLMLAISKGYLRITQVILDHPLSDVKLKGSYLLLHIWGGGASSKVEWGGGGTKKALCGQKGAPKRET